MSARMCVCVCVCCTLNLHQRFLSEVLEELMEELTAGGQHGFMGSKLMTCSTQDTHTHTTRSVLFTMTEMEGLF